jgi:methyl-accepting chemotaxis protein
MRIRGKLTVYAAATISVFIGAMAVPYVGMVDLMDELERANVTNEELQLVYELHLAGRRMQSVGMNVSMAGGDSVSERGQERLADLRDRYRGARERLLEIPQTSEQEQLVEAIAGGYDRFFRILETDEQGTIVSEQPVPARYLDRVEMENGLTLEESFRRLTASIEKRAASASAETRAAALSRFRFIPIVAAGAAAVLFVLTLLFGRSIVRPIRQTNRMLGELAKGGGDLTRRVESHSRDEIRELTEEVNGFTDTLDGIVVSIKRLTRRGTDIGHQLSSNMNESSAAVTEISGHIESIRKQLSELDQQISTASSAVHQITQSVESLGSRIDRQAETVRDTSATMEQMDTSIRNMDALTREKHETTEHLAHVTSSGEEEVQELDRIMREIVQRTDSMREISSKVVEGIEEVSSGIGEIASSVRYIDEISDQNRDTLDRIEQEVRQFVTSEGVTGERVLGDDHEGNGSASGEHAQENQP